MGDLPCGGCGTAVERAQESGGTRFLRAKDKITLDSASNQNRLTGTVTTTGARPEYRPPHRTRVRLRPASGDEACARHAAIEPKCQRFGDPHAGRSEKANECRVHQRLDRACRLQLGRGALVTNLFRSSDGLLLALGVMPI